MTIRNFFLCKHPCNHNYFRLVFLILAILCLTNCKTVKQKDKEISSAIIDGNYEEAHNLRRQYYSDSKLKCVEWMITIIDEESKAYLSKVIIEDKWKWIIEDNYSYIKGRVKNAGNKTVNYFKVTAYYKDNDETALDTDYTDSFESLGPGMSKEFVIMHKKPVNCKYASIKLEEISLRKVFKNEPGREFDLSKYDLENPEAFTREITDGIYTFRIEGNGYRLKEQ
ncbi:hypothetical protein ES708_31854 [subsurface metagenome]